MWGSRYRSVPADATAIRANTVGSLSCARTHVHAHVLTLSLRSGSAFRERSSLRMSVSPYSAAECSRDLEAWRERARERVSERKRCEWVRERGKNRVIDERKEWSMEGKSSESREVKWSDAKWSKGKAGMRSERVGKREKERDVMIDTTSR